MPNYKIQATYTISMETVIQGDDVENAKINSALIDLDDWDILATEFIIDQVDEAN